MSKPKQFRLDEAKRIGDSLGLDWDQVDLRVNTVDHLTKAAPELEARGHRIEALTKVQWLEALHNWQSAAGPGESSNKRIFQIYRSGGNK